MRTTRSPLAAALLALAGSSLLAGSSSADVLIVDASGGGDFTDLPAAVAAAAEGDTLIVRDGTYAGFSLSGKGLRIVAEREAQPVVLGSIRLLSVPAGRELVLSGLEVSAPYTTDASLVHALTVFNVGAALRVQDCKLSGAPNANSNQGQVGDGSGGSGAVLQNAGDAIFTRCTLTGGRGHENYDCCGTGGEGGEGLFSVGSTLALYDCSVTGGKGGYSGWGGFGGDGAKVPNFGIFAAGTTFTGGEGGYGDDFIFGPGGDGGDALVVGSRGQVAQAQLRDNQYVGGAGGGSFLGMTGSRGGGLVKDPASVVIQYPGSARRFTAPHTAWEGGAFTVQVQGEPGDRVWFPGSPRTKFKFAPGLSGVWSLVLPVPMLSAPQGIIPAGGTLELTGFVGQLPAGAEADLRHQQGYVISASGQPFLGTPVSMVRLACTFSPDCDASGVPDACEIQSGASSDCNHNGIPDSCDIASGVLPDCNLNGVADACDIAGGTSADCDADGIPDECQYDCNGNGIADVCDVLSGFSLDCDGNLVPDECDADCNANGVPDGCDIALGTSLDTNGNGVPDECQSAGSTWFVDDDGPPYGNDGTLAKPFDTLQKAFDYAIDGNTLIVRDGTYTGPDNRGVHFAGRDLTVVSENGAAGCVIDCESLERAFVFDGGTSLAARLEGLTVRNGNSLDASPSPDRGGGVLVASGSGATLVDCVIESCEASIYGGGVFVGTFANAILEGCTLRDNSAIGGFSTGMGGGGLSSFGVVALRGCSVDGNTGFQGAGIMLASGSALIEDCIVTNNVKQTFGQGGGIWHLGNGPVTVLRTRITGNTGGAGAPGFYSESTGNVRLSHCVVSGNVGNSLGGGVGLRNFSPQTMNATIEHCLISGNQAGTGGGLIAVRIPSLVVRDCTIVDNAAVQASGAWVERVPTASFENCVLWGNTAGFQAPSLVAETDLVSVDFCDVEGGLAGAVTLNGGSFNWGAGNIDANPLFVDADGPDNNPFTWQDNDYRLGALSPCVDAGDNAAVLADVFDLDGDLDVLEPVPLDLDLMPRFVDDPAVADSGAGTAPIVDMGAFEKP